MEAAEDGGGGAVMGTYGPMVELSSQLSTQANTWTEAFSVQLGTSGNPTLDGAISDLGGQFRAAAGQLSGSSLATSGFVSTTSTNFHSADRGGS